MMIAAYFLSFLCFILISFLFIPIRPPFNWVLPMVTTALSPFLVFMGGLGAGLGWLYHAPIAVAAGLLGAGMSVIYIALVTVPQPSFDLAFGKDWKTRIPPTRESHMLKRRWSLGWPRTGEPCWERDIPFWTIPGTDRKLSCDVWQPPEGAARSGLAFVYLHGSGWYALDKDVGTRPMFRHLADQGHVVMDVSYRLMPEVDIYGMVGDVKRAVSWIKDNAGRYGVNPERIVLGVFCNSFPHFQLIRPMSIQFRPLLPSMGFTIEDRAFVMLETIGQTRVRESDKQRLAFRTDADT